MIKPKINLKVYITDRIRNFDNILKLLREVKKLILSVALLSLATVTMCQPKETVDAKANSILDALTRKTKSYKSIKAEFTVITYGRDKKPTDTQKGSLTVKGGKYKLDIKNQTVICDSTTTWTYLKDANEVQINTVDPTEKGSITPSNIFTIYQNGFKKHYEGEKTKGATTYETVDLYPNHPEKEKYHTLKLVINKQKNQIAEVIVLMKDGTMVKYSIDGFIANQDIPASTFTFDKSKYPGVEVEDLRD